MRPAFWHGSVLAIINGYEDVGCASEVREGGDEGEWVGSLHEHEGHGRTEEDDVGSLMLGKEFTFEVSVKRCDLVFEEVASGESSLLFPKRYALKMVDDRSDAGLNEYVWGEGTNIVSQPVILQGVDIFPRY